MRIVLASASPRRRELLAAAGIAFDVDAAHVDETPAPGEDPPAYVERLARMKAETTARRHPGRVVLGADTVVAIAGRLLGKPSSPAEAADMLRALSSRAHEVLTGIAVTSGRETRTAVERTTVVMRAISDREIADYVATGEPMDKAGAYAIQGGASAFVLGIEGDYDTVVGLPVRRVARLLGELAGLPYPLSR